MINAESLQAELDHMIYLCSSVKVNDINLHDLNDLEDEIFYSWQQINRIKEMEEREDERHGRDMNQERKDYMKVKTRK